jgi:hypothetical protein
MFDLFYKQAPLHSVRKRNVQTETPSVGKVSGKFCAQGVSVTSAIDSHGR